MTADPWLLVDMATQSLGAGSLTAGTGPAQCLVAASVPAEVQVLQDGRLGARKGDG
jgi:hypothetical protein